MTGIEITRLAIRASGLVVFGASLRASAAARFRHSRDSVMRGLGGSTILLLALSVASLAAQETSLISFELEDQFERVYRDSDYVGQILIVIGSDREGSEFNQAWGEALDDALADEPGFERIAFLPVADLTGVPFFIKGMVRRRFPKEPDQWALMDWDGVFDGAYGFVPEATNILLFTPRGELLQHAHGRELDHDALQSIVFTTRLLLADGG